MENTEAVGTGSERCAELMRNKKFYKTMQEYFVTLRMDGMSLEDAYNEVQDKIIFTAIGTLVGDGKDVIG